MDGTGSIQGLSHLGVGRTLSRTLERQQQPLMVEVGRRRRSGRVSVTGTPSSPLTVPNGQPTGEEATPLALGPPLPRLGGEVPRVPLGQSARACSEEEALRRRVVEVGLRDRGDTHVRAAELLQAFKSHAQLPSEAVHLVDHDDAEAAGLGISHQPREVGPLGEVVGVGGHALVGVVGDDRVAPISAEVVAGTALGVQAVALDLLLRRHADIGGGEPIVAGPSSLWHTDHVTSL